MKYDLHIKLIGLIAQQTDYPISDRIHLIQYLIEKIQSGEL